MADLVDERIDIVSDEPLSDQFGAPADLFERALDFPPIAWLWDFWHDLTHPYLFSREIDREWAEVSGRIGLMEFALLPSPEKDALILEVKRQKWELEQKMFPMHPLRRILIRMTAASTRGER